VRLDPILFVPGRWSGSSSRRHGRPRQTRRRRRLCPRSEQTRLAALTQAAGRPAKKVPGVRVGVGRAQRSHVCIPLRPARVRLGPVPVQGDL